MSYWTQRVAALFGGHPSPAPAAVTPRGVPVHLPDLATHGVPTAALPATAEAVAGLDPRAAFFEWLAGPGSVLAAPLTLAEQRLLSHLDTLLGSDTAGTELLPRAPSVIPQLMKSLRDEGQSAHALAQRVEKDANLVAEVIRLASSVHARADRPVADLADAIRRLGTEGLRRAIAMVVLKPIFDAPSSSLSGRAAPRLWAHADAQAQAGTELAAASGLDPFEAFVAGLMHNTGWSAALRAVDRAEGGAPARFTQAFVLAFDTRRELFFARLVKPWQLNAPLTRLADALLRGEALADAGPLGQLLAAADRAATSTLLPHIASPAPAPIDRARLAAVPRCTESTHPGAAA